MRLQAPANEHAGLFVDAIPGAHDPTRRVKGPLPDVILSSGIPPEARIDVATRVP